MDVDYAESEMDALTDAGTDQDTLTGAQQQQQQQEQKQETQTEQKKKLTKLDLGLEDLIALEQQQQQQHMAGSSRRSSRTRWHPARSVAGRNGLANR